MLTKQAATTIAAMLGIALSAQWAVPALAGPAQSSTEMRSPATPVLHIGDLVRLRSGGPLLTVKSVQGNEVICSWWSEEMGEFGTTGFPMAMLTGPVPPPSNEATVQRDQAGANQY